MRTGARGALLALAMVALLACGKDVDLGGTSDAAPGVMDGTLVAGGECAPCVAASDCASGVCAKYADYLFCTTDCSSTSPCAGDETCSALVASSGAKISACLPTATKCAPDNGPIGPDGAPLEHCNNGLDAPLVTSTCKACGGGADECQPNGCYGGYWCDSAKTDCVTPPKTCN